MVNGFRYYRALESVSIALATQLCLPLLPFTHARSESINADSLNSNFLQLGIRSGGRPQRAVHPMRLPVNTVIHTTLVGLEPATFRSLVDCWSDALPVVSPTHSLSLFQAIQLYATRTQEQLASARCNYTDDEYRQTQTRSHSDK